MDPIKPLKANLTYEQADDKAKTFLHKASGLAHSILPKESNQTVINHNYYGYDSWYWPWHHHSYYPVFINNSCNTSTPCSTSKDEKRKSDERTFLIVAAGVVAVAYGVVSVVQNASSLIRLNESINKTERFKNWFNQVIEAPKFAIEKHAVEKINKVIEKEGTIFKRSQDHERTKGYLNLGIGVCGALTLASVIKNDDTLLALGLIGGVASIVSAIFYRLVNNTQEKNEKDAEKILIETNLLFERYPEIIKPMRIKEQKPSSVVEEKMKKESLEEIEKSTGSGSLDLGSLTSLATPAA